MNEIELDEEPTIMDVTILGRSIGEASGWDQWTDFGLIFYDFVPNEYGRLFLGGPILAGSLAVDFNTGVVEACNGDGETQLYYKADWSVFNNRSQ